MRRGWPCAASPGPSAMRHSAVRRAWQVVRIGDATPARPAAPAPRRPCVPAGSVYFSVKMNIHASVSVGVLGASGYVGQELLRLLARHPGASVVFATAESADRKSTRLNSSHSQISYAVFCLKKKKKKYNV